MSTGLDAFDTTLEKSNLWLKDLMQEMGWQNKHLAYAALRAVLHTLRDRLPVAEAADLGAELPLLLRGVYYDGWRPAGKPVKMDRYAFVAEVENALRNEPPVDPEAAIRAVFRVMARHIAAGEMWDVAGILPEGIRALWENPVGASQA